jgi:hypothetical protein
LDKFFFWLLLRDRLSTRNLLRRKKCSWMIIPVFSAQVVKKRVSTSFLNVLSAGIVG